MVLLEAEGLESQAVAVEAATTFRGYSRASWCGPHPLSSLGLLPGFPSVSTLYLISYQHLHASTVERLPGRLSYPCPRLPEVGRPLRNLVAEEHDEIERLRTT